MINDIIVDASLTTLTWVFVYRKRKVILFYSTDADTNMDQSERSLRLSNINDTTITLLRCIETTQACGIHKRTILDYRQNFFLVTLRFQLKQISFIISVCRISTANILIRSYIGSPCIHVRGSSKYKFLILSMPKLHFTSNMLSKHSSYAAYVTILCFCFSFMTN